MLDGNVYPWQVRPQPPQFTARQLNELEREIARREVHSVERNIEDIA